jgi:hypothetical protein
MFRRFPIIGRGLGPGGKGNAFDIFLEYNQTIEHSKTVNNGRESRKPWSMKECETLSA